MHNGTVSMWETCAGLLGHVHFTLPLAKNPLGQYVPTTLTSVNSGYSPYTPSTTANLTALENFVLQVVSHTHTHSLSLTLSSTGTLTP